MELKDIIKSKLCLIRMTPNYPLHDFVRWVDESAIDNKVLLSWLDIIQVELDREAFVDASSSEASQHQVLKSYWSLYCSQVRAYYRAIERDPACKAQLAFLLQSR